MKRLLFSLLVGLTVFGTVLGLAASLTLTTDSLGAGSSAVTACDSTPDISYTVDASLPPNLDDVVVTLDAACNGATVYVTLDLATDLQSSATVTTGVATVDFLSDGVDPADISTAITVTIVGP